VVVVLRLSGTYFLLTILNLFFSPTSPLSFTQVSFLTITRH
jgi:hypothetical protein